MNQQEYLLEQVQGVLETRGDLKTAGKTSFITLIPTHQTLMLVTMLFLAPQKPILTPENLKNFLYKIVSEENINPLGGIEIGLSERPTKKQDDGTSFVGQLAYQKSFGNGEFSDEFHPDVVKSLASQGINLAMFQKAELYLHVLAYPKFNLAQAFFGFSQDVISGRLLTSRSYDLFRRL